jgi:hypothetical protein
VTRQGLNHVWAAATALWPTAHLMPDVVDCDPMVSFDPHSSTRNRRTERQYAAPRAFVCRFCLARVLSFYLSTHSSWRIVLTERMLCASEMSCHPATMQKWR